MRTWHRLAIPFSLVPLIGISMARPSGLRLNSAGSTDFKKSSGGATASPLLDQAVWPFLAKNCTSCHNAKVKSGGLDLQTLHSPDSGARMRETWENIVRKIQNGEMPPKGSPQPAPSESASTIHRIQSEFDRLDKSTADDPGRVTARRLNRAEYNNTVRDLVGVDFRPADDFPQDDSGYGFDNIGDVLSLSPSQMDMYVSAAEKIARTALYGAEPMQPELLRLEGSGRPIEDKTVVPASYDVSGLTLPNSVHGNHRFPVDGEYLFRFGLNGLRPLGSEAIHLCLWIDGVKVQSMDFDTSGNAAFNPDRQDFSGRTRDCRLHVTQGDHWIDATIENLYDGLPPAYGGPNPSKKVIKPLEFKPPPGFPPDRLEAFRKRFEARQNEKVATNDVRVSHVDIGGPYDQPKGPSEESLRKIFTCGHLHGGHDASCTRKIISNLASRAFRRPVTAYEIDRLASLVKLAQSHGDSYEEGICLAMQGILVSPNFLFRIEKDPAPLRLVSTVSDHLVSQYELASRLSYFLWSTMPDDELRACAERQTLRKPEVLEAQIRRML